MMEKWLTPDIGRLFSILGIGFISLAVVMGFVINRIRGAFKPFARNTLIYVVVAAAISGLTGFVMALSWFSSYLQYFILMQGLFLAFGIVNVWSMRRFLKWVDADSFWAEMLLSLAITLLGCIFFIMTFRVVNREGLEFAMATAGVCFLLPRIVYQTYLAALDIRPKILRQWHYPVHESVAEPDLGKLRNLLVISFEFQKKPTDKYFTNFRAKAPVDMEFGQLFYYFINDYNDRHANDTIRYVSESGAPSGWIFYKKPKWYHLITRYIDADRTIFVNKIKENDIIICSRIS